MNSYHDWYGDGPRRRPRRSRALAAFFLFFHLAPISTTTVAQQQHQQQVHIHIHDENGVHLPSAPSSSDDHVGGGDFLDLHQHPPPPPPPPYHAAGQDVRSYLLTQARKAAEAVQNPGPNDELSRVAMEIKELKQQIQRMNETSTTTGSTSTSITTITPTTVAADIGMMKERLRELEQRRILLLRQGMLKHQFQMPQERINSELV